MHRLSYKVLLLFTILASIGGLLTLLPREAAGYPNILGYRSLCTFAPAASFFCFLLAGISCFIRATFVKDQSGNPGNRFGKHRRALIPLILVLLIALGSTVWFLQVKSRYPRGGSDTETAATASEKKGE